MKQDARPAALVVLVAMLAMAPVAPAFGQSPTKWPSSSAPRPLPAHEVRFPPYELRTLDNGLQVVIVMHHEQPAVSLRLIVGAGGAHDPAAKPGVAALLTSVLDQGTTTKTAQQVADAIDFVGGKLETGVGRDLCWAQVVVMKDSYALAMKLLADVVRNPAFAEEEVARQRKQTLSALEVSQQDPDYIANVVFDRLVYGFNPYGTPGNGTAESVARIGRDDLVAFHQAYFAPNNALLAVVGDLTVDEAMARVNESFGAWSRHDVPSFNPAPPPEPARRVVVVDKPDAVQTEVRVGQLGIARKTADFTAVDLAVRVLGGEGANRLHRVLRTERGLTYGVRADAQTLKRAGTFVIQTNTRSEATGEVLRLIADEYSRLRRERVGDEELSEAKAYLTGHFPLTIETPDEIATQVLNVLFYDLPVQDLQTYRQRVNAVSVEDVARVTWKYVRPDRLAIVLVGNASAFADQLKGVGFGKYELVKLAALDLTAPDFKKKDATGDSPAPSTQAGDERALRVHGPAVPEDDGRQAPAQGGASDPAQALIGRAIDAKGGRAKLESVKTVEAVATTTLMTPGGPARTETTTYIQYPDRFRVEAHVALGTVVQVYAGPNHVWVLDPGKGLVEVPAQVRKDFKAGVDRDVIPLLLRTARGELKVRMLEPGTDPKVQAVEVSGGGIEPITLYIDVDSGLVVRESYHLEGGSGNAEELFADYRDVDGLQVAFRATVRRNGLPVLERTVTSFKLNPPLAPGLFDAPTAPKDKLSPSSQAPPKAAVAAPAPVSPPATAAPKTTMEGARPAPKPSVPAPKPSAPAIAASEPEAMELVRKAIDATGGLERLKAVRTLRITATNVMITPDGKSKSESVSCIEYPDRFRVDVRQSGQTAIALLAGNTLTVRTPDGVVGSPTAGSEGDRSFKGSVQRDLVPLLLRIAAGELRVRIVPQDPEVQEVSRERLVQVSGAQFDTVVVGFDATTGLVRRISYTSPGAEKQPWVDDTFSDYRDVSGVKMPFHNETRRDTWLLKDRTVKEIVVNSPLEPSLFDKSRLK